MQKILYILITSTTLLACKPSNEFTKRVFHDEFTEFNLKTWKHEITLGGGGNWEFQYYNNNRSSSFVKDGNLYIKPVLTTEVLGINQHKLINDAVLDVWGRVPDLICTSNADYGCSRSSNGHAVINPVMSAKIKSRDFSFKYGQVKVRAKLPKGDWLWPAIWLMPSYASYGGWPASGEIDFIESRGNANYSFRGVDSVSSTLHWGPNFELNKYSMTDKSYKLPTGLDFSQNFHNYTLEWTENYIKTWVDDHIVLNVDYSKRSLWDQANLDETGAHNPWESRGNSAPFDQEFHLIINVAVGGTAFFPDHPHGIRDTKKPWINTSSKAAKEFIEGKNQWYPTWHGPDGSDLQSALVVDYISVYQKP